MTLPRALVIAALMLAVSVPHDVWAGAPADQLRMQIDRVVQALSPQRSAPTHELASRVTTAQRTEAHLKQDATRGLFGAVPGGMVSVGRAVSGGHGDLQGAGAPRTASD